jgi:hypothetical protein
LLSAEQLIMPENVALFPLGLAGRRQDQLAQTSQLKIATLASQGA